MIYLKTFNESVEKDIIPITHTEFYSLLSKSIKIEQKEISKLKDFFEQYPTTEVKIAHFNAHLDIYRGRGHRGQWLLIYKLDDYYWLVYASTNKDQFLKIDDWEALMRFLEQVCSKLKKIEL